MHQSPLLRPQQPAAYLLFFFLTLRPPPRSTLFPYTTLFRSRTRIRISTPARRSSSTPMYASLLLSLGRYTSQVLGGAIAAMPWQDRDLGSGSCMRGALGIHSRHSPGSGNCSVGTASGAARNRGERGGGGGGCTGGGCAGGGCTGGGCTGGRSSCGNSSRTSR